MSKQSDVPWPGVPFDADGWPYATDPAVFEARRAVGQFARTYNAPFRTSSTDPIPIGLFLLGTQEIAEAIDMILADLVAEARARGLTWKEIGQFLRVGGRAVQNKFGAGLTSERRAELREEAEIVRTTNKSASETCTMPSVTEQLDGTPAERLAYAYHLIDGAKAACREVKNRLNATPPDIDAIPHHIGTAYKKVQKLGLIMMADREQWSAVIEWANQPSEPDHSNYHAPVTYFYLAMRQIAHCCHHFVWLPHNEQLDFCAKMEHFIQADELLDTVIMLLKRDDVKSVSPQGK